MDFRPSKRTDTGPVYINKEAVERAYNSKFLCVHIKDEHSWSKQSHFVVLLPCASEGENSSKKSLKVQTDHSIHAHDEYM